MKKYIIFFAMCAFLVAPVLTFANHTTSHSIEQIQAEIVKIQAQLSVLRASQSAPAVGQSAAGSAGAAVGNAGSNTAVQPYSVRFPIFDDDISNDDIVQFNNLRIQSISGTAFPVVIGASNDLGVRCRKFDSQGVSGSAEFPCPVAPTVLYQIRADEETRLLLRNRLRAKITDFEIGDRINVYGFMDRDIKTIDALIMRNLDKPFREAPIQLNDVSVLKIRKAEGGAPAMLTVVQKGIIGCLEFQSGASGIPFPCPFGIEQKEASTQTIIGNTPPPSIPPLPRKYLVEVSEKTKILNRNRESMAFGDIAVGDILNVYGLQTKELGRIRAEIVRDLSKPAQKSLEGLDVRVSWTNCPPNCQGYESVDDAIVIVRNFGGEIVAEKKAPKGRVIFNGLLPGIYVVYASASEYSSAESKVDIKRSEEWQVLNLVLKKKMEGCFCTREYNPVCGIDGKTYGNACEAKCVKTEIAYLGECRAGEENRPPVISGVSGPVTLKAGETGTWSIKAYDPEQKPLRYSVVWGDETAESQAATAPPTAYIQTATFTHSYAKAGIYNPTFTVTDSAGFSAKTSASVKVGDTAVSSITVLSPNGGEVWRQGSQQIIKWTPSKSLCPSGAYCIVADETVDIQLMPYAPPCIGATCPLAPDILYLIAANTRHDGEFEWTVGKTLYGQQVLDGKYIISVVKSGTGISDQSDAPFSIAAENTLKVISPNGGEQWLKGSMQKIRWSAPSSVSNVSISLEAWFPCLYTKPACAIAVRPHPLVLAASAPNNGIFEWTVGKDALGSDISAGQYIVTITGGEFFDASDKPFTITATITAVPFITSLQPISGLVGTKVTVTGIGFTSANNSIKFGGGYLNGLSSNGAQITFTVPDGLGLCPPGALACPLSFMRVTPGIYPVSVINANGASNTMNFTVERQQADRFFIDPASAGIKVGGTGEFRALLDNCPPDAACFAGPLSVQATWTSSNPKVAAIAYKEIPCPAGSYCFAQQFDYLTAVAAGVSLGSTVITATYKDSSGAVFTENAVVTTVMP